MHKECDFEDVTERSLIAVGGYDCDQVLLPPTFSPLRTSPAVILAALHPSQLRSGRTDFTQ